MLGQVLVFALLLLPKGAAGLAACSGLAFAGHPPTMQKEVSVNACASCDATRRDETIAVGEGAALPLLQLWGGDKSCKVGSVALHSALPPVGILLVDDLNDVTGLKLKAGFFAWDDVIFGWVVVKLGSHVHLLYMKTYGVSFV